MDMGVTKMVRTLRRLPHWYGVRAMLRFYDFLRVLNDPIVLKTVTNPYRESVSPGYCRISSSIFLNAAGCLTTFSALGGKLRVH